MHSTLNFLPLPTPALPGSGVCWSLVSSQWSLVIIKLTRHSLFTTHNNGFDLSPSFSLIAQSKAPLENYGANIGLDVGFFTLGFFNGVQESLTTDYFMGAKHWLKN
jgi:hypothetical protein